jgi:hypothetical protein
MVRLTSEYEINCPLWAFLWYPGILPGYHSLLTVVLRKDPCRAEISAAIVAVNRILPLTANKHNTCRAIHTCAYFLQCVRSDLLLEDSLHILGLIIDLPLIINEDKIIQQDASQRLGIALLMSFSPLTF